MVFARPLRIGAYLRRKAGFCFCRSIFVRFASAFQSTAPKSGRYGDAVNVYIATCRFAYTLLHAELAEADHLFRRDDIFLRNGSCVARRVLSPPCQI